MSRMLSKMNLISVVRKLPKEDIETIQGYVEMIEEENQELKSQLKGTTHCFDEEEHEKLKKQLEAYETYFNRFFKLNNKIYDGKIILKLLDKKETQQKEFIKFLENELLDARYYARDIAHFIEYVLQKYKKLIGVSDEKGN